MAVTEAYTMSAVTVGSTELSVVSGTTTLQNVSTAGAYQLVLDAANMAKGDEFIVRVYEKTLSGGTKRRVAQWSLLGAQTELFISPAMMLLNGWDFTIQKSVGTDRAFTASIRKAG